MSNPQKDIPKKIGKYTIYSVLGQGAMGLVYKAFDPHIERYVALKTIAMSNANQAENQVNIERFQREAKAAGRLNHPNIVSLYEYNNENQIAFIAMEYVEGIELQTLFAKQQRFRLKDTVYIIRQVLSALSYSHAQGVIHRDIKPANIFLDKSNTVKLGDFGIAKVDNSNLTQTGVILGTPSYISPEQILGKKIDGRADLFAVGVILYQFLSGEKPFKGELTTIIHNIINVNPAPPSQIRTKIPPQFDQIVLKALAKNPQERYSSAEEFSQALEHALQQQTQSANNQQQPPPQPTTPVPSQGVAIETNPPQPSIITNKKDPLLITVSPWGSSDFTLLSDAVHAAQAHSQILIHPGLYQEERNIILNKALKLRAFDDTQKTIIECYHPSGIQIASDQVEIYGLHFYGKNTQSRSCLDFVSGRSIIDACSINNYGIAAVSVQSDARILMNNCIVQGIDYAIYFYPKSGGKIENCKLSALRDKAILLKRKANPRLINNAIENNSNTKKTKDKKRAATPLQSSTRSYSLSLLLTDIRHIIAEGFNGMLKTCFISILTIIVLFFFNIQLSSLLFGTIVGTLAGLINSGIKGIIAGSLLGSAISHSEITLTVAYQLYNIIKNYLYVNQMMVEFLSRCCDGLLIGFALWGLNSFIKTIRY